MKARIDWLKGSLATYRGEQGFSGSLIGRITDKVYVSGGVAGSMVKGSTTGRVGMTFGFWASRAEARRLVNATDISFRPMVQAALLTGARYSELANLETRDFDRQARTLRLRATKSGDHRDVYLGDEAFTLVDSIRAASGGLEIVVTDNKVERLNC